MLPTAVLLKEADMATYIVLGKFTDQGIRSVKDTTKRAEAFRAMASKVGATVKDVYWTLGQFDVVTVVDAADDATLTTLLLSAGALGNLHTQSLRAFSADEMGRIVGKMV
jgi:uncharacterized protein with GYD domain